MSNIFNFLNAKLTSIIIRGMIIAATVVVTSSATAIYINHSRFIDKKRRQKQTRRGTRGHARAIRRGKSNLLTNLHLEAESLCWAGLHKAHDIVGIRRQLKNIVDIKGLEMYVDGTTDLEMAIEPTKLTEVQKQAAVNAAIEHIFDESVVEDIEEEALERDESTMRLVSLGSGQIMSSWALAWWRVRRNVARYTGFGSITTQH